MMIEYKNSRLNSNLEHSHSNSGQFWEWAAQGSVHLQDPNFYSGIILFIAAVSVFQTLLIFLVLGPLNHRIRQIQFRASASPKQYAPGKLLTSPNINFLAY